MAPGVDKKNICAIIQARMGSVRLPNKVLWPVEGKPMLWHIIERVKKSKEIGQMVLAIPDTKENNALEEFAKQEKIPYFRGSEDDVLNRFYEAAKQYHADVIVRVTADNPFIDPNIVDVAVKSHLQTNADYSSTHFESKLATGFAVEVCSFTALKKANSEAKELQEREHVMPYFYKNPDIFSINKIDIKGYEDSASFRLTVDTKEDMELALRIYKELYKPGEIFYLSDIIDLLKNKKPELTKINENIPQKKVT